MSVILEGMGRPPGCKLIRITAAVEDGVFRSLSIRGDFFASPEEAFDRAQEALVGTPVADVEQNFARFLEREGVDTFGVCAAGLAEVLRNALPAAPAGALS
ncbi:MAG: hypothetical protein LBB82_06015 [Treponema sp.]|nr:hypothetical protein [Treponema sp.]